MRDRITLVGTRRPRLIGLVLTNSKLVLLSVATYTLSLVAFAQLLGSDNVIAHASAAASTMSCLLARKPFRRLLNSGRWSRGPRSRAQQLPLIREISAALTHAAAPETVYTLLMEDLPRRLGLGRARLWVLQPPEDLVFVGIGIPKTSESATLLVNGASVRHVARASGYVPVPAGADADWSAPFREQQVPVVVPLKVAERLVGIYGVEMPPRRQGPPPDALELLLTLTPTIAAVLEYTRAYARIDRLNARLHKLDLLKDQFIESVGHELRTPLTTLSLSVQLLLNQPQIPSGLAGIVRGSLSRLQTLIDRVLLFEEQTHQAISKQAANTLTELGPLLNEIAEHYAPIVHTKGMHLSVHVQDGLAIWGATTTLAHALHEVVDNAIRYSKSGEIRMTAMFKDGLALISVADQGPGIPQEEQDRLFAAFHRGKRVRALADSPGAGLGLCLARRDLERLDGRIWLARSGPDGSELCVAVPAMVLPLEAAAQRAGINRS